MNERRILRLQKLIKARVAEVIARDLADPRRGLITITRVKLDREIMTCKVYWSILGNDAELHKNERMLEHAARFIQKEVGQVLHTRRVPRVTFIHDESIEGAIRLTKILRELGDARDQADAAGDQTEQVDPPATHEAGDGLAS